MSTSSTQSRGIRRRVDSHQGNGHLSREDSHVQKPPLSHNDAYLYTLRVAYLAYLLQPRAKRLQHVSAPPAPVQRSSTSINDLMRDFSLVRDSKSTRFPHGFMGELDKRLTGVLMGKEKRPEYNDSTVKRSFAAFFNAFSEPNFKKRMEKDRRVEDLVLIFFSNATKEMSKGKGAGEDGWKSLVDRHVALFVRLVSLVLKDHDWVRDRPELSSRLATLESKLLSNDQDLSSNSSRSGIGASSTVETIVPLSYEVKDMALVQVVGRVFGKRGMTLQSDIDNYKSSWTEQVALQDLKTYQTCLNVGSRYTLGPDDFDLDEAYDQWKKGEAQDISQMVLVILQSNPELAKSPSGNLSQFNSHLSNGHGPGPGPGSDYPESLRRTDSRDGSPYVIDQPVDMSGYGASVKSHNAQSLEGDDVFTFIPPDTRAFYRFVLAQTLTCDLDDEASLPAGTENVSTSTKLLSKQSTDLLNEICLRWRIPPISRMLLFLDVVREKFVDQQISLDKLDAAFNFVKASPEKGKGRSLSVSILQDREKWLLVDTALFQKTLGTLHMALLRDLFEQLQLCYEKKAPPIGSIVLVLEEHIYGDENFSESSEKMGEYRHQMYEGLTGRAYEIYREFLQKEVPNDQYAWEFIHVIDLGKAVAAIIQRVEKRFKKNPAILGVTPLTALIETILPLYAQDAKGIVERIMMLSKQGDEEIAVEDGFILYGELVEIRQLHSRILPDVPFAFHVEGLLADFVWRWISMTEETITDWVDQAVKQDHFAVRAEKGQIPTEDQRHSVSVIDIFSSFNQSIDRIVQLNWDDDLQYAKFMTAAAKVVGIGVARYCEIVEQRFSREMDRLSPEQEAAKSQSTQDKWIAMAKDAWKNKEKIEPFQFYPESFVKLNNVNFAAKQLDKLEHEVNVDACAEVIRKHAPPIAQRQRKASNYVFTIKIVEAEDLKACDVSGYSDPYVVLGDEYQKRLAKTRIIYRNLNPRWDETVDITTQGPLNVVATVWDWDAMGDHDCVGRASLKLDPSHFGDFLPREYWLDLDTKGRILLRVSMEGERDDIQFYFGKAFRTIKRTERDMTRMITDKLSAYITHCLSLRTLKSLLSKGINLANVSDKLSSVSSYFKNIKAIQPTQQQPLSEAETTNALKLLFAYFDDNFAIMNQTLTNSSMIMVMTRLWKEVLSTIESLLVPPLSDKPSRQQQLNQQEMDIVFKWLQYLFDFFHAVDEETGEANGVPLGVLRSPKYFDVTSLNFFYFDTTENLIRTSERMASATAARQQDKRNRLSAPPSLASPAFGGAAGLISFPSTSRRSKSIMLSRNLGTMKKAKEEKWKEAQAEPSDDMILRILRMRSEAERYLKDRSRQKERLAAAAAAEMIVKQSLLAGGGRMMGNLPRR
ncbi:uncharacterized protein KY384_001452 [Bacidia gigantensis]|uniref:uncharacterized protein n=1 Tax=Bacidia gigantensis TaxID=2732470 RepID=UPI001D05501B|nr:uncharacterized protein KY384_001452 [Bacidia gigantensis]KAG8533711.1 hypothetical protein KY384_001452 [Bacidia gigantensis]